MNRLILIDFDGTLFDSDSFKKELVKFWNDKYGITQQQWDATYEPSRNEHGAYDYFQHLSQFLDTNRETLKTEFIEYFRAHDFYFHDALEFLKKHEEDKLIIFTLGYDDFQSMKIDTNEYVSKIKRIAISGHKGTFFADNLDTSSDKLKFSGIDGEFNEIWYVDNRPTYFMKDVIPTVRQIRVFREGKRYSDIPTPVHIEEVKLLTDIS